MEFYRTPEERVIEVLQKRYLDDVPENIEIPLSFKTPIYFQHLDYSDPNRGGLINHTINVELFRAEPFLNLSLSLSSRPIFLIFSIVFVIHLALSHFVLGNWIWVFSFSFVFGLSYWYCHFLLTSRFEQYCEKLKKEIIG